MMVSRDLITYAIIIVACIILVVLVSMQDFGKTRTVHEMYLSSYPKQIEPGENITFSLTLGNEMSSAIQYTILILIDGEETYQRNVAVPAGSKQTEEFNIPQDFYSGERYKVEILLYNENQDPDSYGSLEHPYYVFFRVDVI